MWKVTVYKKDDLRNVQKTERVINYLEGNRKEWLLAILNLYLFNSKDVSKIEIIKTRG